MSTNKDCGCGETANPRTDSALELLGKLGEEIARMPTEDLFDLPVGRVRQAFQNVYDIAAGMLGRGQEEFLLRGRQGTYKCSPASLYMPELPEGINTYLRTYVDRSHFTHDDSLFSQLFGRQSVWPAAVPIALVADYAYKGGNTRAATNLSHWLAGSGEPMLNYDVESMIRDIPRWRADIAAQLEKEILGLIKKNLREDPAVPCQVYIANTASDNSPNGGKTWRRVGIGNRIPKEERIIRDIYSGGKGIPVSLDAMLGRVPPPDGVTQREYDWYLAMNAFDYSLAIALVWNSQTDDVSLCYRVDIADEYAWYHTDRLAEIMGEQEMFGAARSFAIRGSSKTRCLPEIKLPYAKRKEITSLPYDFMRSLLQE